MDEKVEEIVQEVEENSDVKRETIIEEIEEKQEELSGFVTPEGAAIIVARKYGVTPEREEPEVRKLRIEDLSEGMSNVDIVGRIARVLEPQEFDRKDGSKGKVANLTLIDKTGEVRVVLWGKMADLVLEREIQKGAKIRFEGAYTKKGRTNSLELHMGRRGEIELEPDGERAEELPPAEDIKTKISELDSSSDMVDVVGRVITVTTPREFERSDGSKGKVATLRIADDTGQTRVSLWGDKSDKTEKIGQGDAIRLENASVREGQQGTPELNMNWQGRIVLNPSSEEVEELPEFEKNLLKIEEIEPDMPMFDVAAKVRRTFPPKEFSRDDGSTGKVMNVLLADETGTIRVSFWDDMVEIGQKLSPEDTVLLENARSSVGLRDKPEIRVGQRTNIEVNPEDVEIEEMKPSRVKMSELEEGLDSLEVTGRVIDISGVNEFTRSDESEGKVASLTLGDQTGTGRVTLWGPKTDILDKLEVGDVIKITDSYSVSGNYGSPEIHVGDRGNVEIDPPAEEDFPPVDELKGSGGEEEVKIEEAEEGSQVRTRGTIVRIFQRDPIFEVCPNCERSLGGENTEALCEKCEEVVEPEYRVVLNLILDDGTGNIRVVAFGEVAEKLLGEKAEEVQKSLKEIELSEFYEDLDLVGGEATFTGSVRRDDYYDQLELRATEVDFPEPEKEIKKILGKIKSSEES